MSGYKTGKFIGMYVNETSYDYFVIQYIELRDGWQSNASARDSSLQTILVFYRHNDEYSRVCGNVGGWADV